VDEARDLAVVLDDENPHGLTLPRGGFKGEAQSTR
jgi:hypothetical protein